MPDSALNRRSEALGAWAQLTTPIKLSQEPILSTCMIRSNPVENSLQEALVSEDCQILCHESTSKRGAAPTWHFQLTPQKVNENVRVPV